jgi:hypothetical protein
MRIAIFAAALGLLATTTQASAQSYGLPPGPKLGEIEVKAYQKIPKTKVAVQLTSDTHLSRELRREVMTRLSKRGNEVGFSGGNVMRLEITYFDLSGGSGKGGQAAPSDGIPAIEGPGANPRLDLPRNKIERRDGYQAPLSGPTLRMTLTLYAVDTGKVLWAATASCIVGSNNAEQAGISMVNAIFEDPDNNRIADAGCPL